MDRSFASFLPGIARVALLSLLLLLTGCPRPVTGPSATGQAPLVIAPGAQHFQILPDESQLVLLVYREGQLARLGHNHVISTKHLNGNIYIATDMRKSSAELSFAVADLEVDRENMRAQFGPDFSTTVTADAVEGTRQNMLGEQQLNAAVWPEIVARSRAVTGIYPDLTLQVEVIVQGQAHDLDVPIKLQLEGTTLRAEAAFSFNQTEIGLAPFSVMLGALRVRDQIDARLQITARAD